MEAMVEIMEGTVEEDLLALLQKMGTRIAHRKKVHLQVLQVLQALQALQEEEMTTVTAVKVKKTVRILRF